MKYEDALAEWGARQLEKNYPGDKIDRDTVRVDLGYEPESGGCDTCGYGSRGGFSTVEISARTIGGTYEWLQIEDANMLDVFKGLMEVSGGTISE